MKNFKKIIEKVFSVKNEKIYDRNYKVLTILGVRIKQTNKYKNLDDKYNCLDSRYADINQEIQSMKKEFQPIITMHNFKTKRSINKEKILSKIEMFNECGVAPDKRTPKIIVSLTSYPERMYDIHYTLYSLLTQDFKPDELILWLADEQFPNREKDIPQKVLKLKENGLTIKWCEDIKSYKKLIPALKEYPDDIIVTADDDIYYAQDWLKKLHDEYQNSDKQTIIAHRCHKINITDQIIMPYSTWKKCIINTFPSFSNFSTSGGGVMYPPYVLAKEITNKNLFMNLCPNADDIWLWGMAVLNKTKIKTVLEPNKLIYINPERELNCNNDGTLFSSNKTENDRQLISLIETFPQIMELLNKNNIKVSVVIPVYNVSEYLNKCLDSVCSQTLKEIEIICINDGSTDNSLQILEEYAQKDKRIVLINKENSGAANSRNIGLKVAKGEYIGFVDGDDWIDTDYYEKLYNKALQTNADIVRCTYKYCYQDRMEESELNRIILNCIKTQRNLNINEHSVVIWNAIYHSEFLKTNKIDYFDSDLPMCHDVPFTARVDFLSKRTVPACGGYYYYRKSRPHQLITPSVKRMKCIMTANERVVNFINSLNELETQDYLTAFKRCIARFNNMFYEYSELFDTAMLETCVVSFIKLFHKCKYHDEFINAYNEEYFRYLEHNDPKGYINMVKTECKNRA